MNSSKFSRIWYGIGILLLLNAATYIGLAQGGGKDYARLHFFDIGQGDSIYLRTVEGNDVLIDGGPGDAVLSKLGEAMPFFDRTVEFVILTHPHADHVSGLIEVLQRYKVKNLLFNELAYESATYRTFLAQARLEGANLYSPRLGERVFLDSVTALDIYHPISTESIAAGKDVNETSIVAKLSFGSTNVLFTGDAGHEVEEKLLSWKLPVDAEILKVGHQGSKTSTSEQFLDAVDPAAAVIMVGKNSYGHPHEEVLGLLNERVPHLYRTDENGDIIFAIYPDHASRCMDRGCKKQENMK